MSTLDALFRIVTTKPVSPKMKTHSSRATAIALSLLMVSTMVAFVVFIRSEPPGSAPRTIAQAREAFGRLPLSFEANRGQADESINFLARGPGYTLALSPTEAAFALAPQSSQLAESDQPRELVERTAVGDLRKAGSSGASYSAPPPPTVLRMNLVGANRDAGGAGLDALEGKVNYLIGNDRTQWRTDIPTFGRVRYHEIYPGIDLVYYGNQRQLEYDFVVAPGTDAQMIALEFAGADRVEIEEATGDLLLSLGENIIRQRKPVSYQETNGARRKVESRYAIKDNGRVGFEVGEYDRSAPLIIDPVLVYSTYLGGSDFEEGSDIKVDSAGNAYICGITNSTDFPTANAIQGTFGGRIDDLVARDGFVTKINAAGTAFVYSTYLGGNKDDWCNKIAVDASGNAYVAGETGSANFPTANAFQATFGGGLSDAFITKINAAGNALVFSTYVGGSIFDAGQGIALDSANNVYFTGRTTSDNYPVVNPIQATYSGGPGADVIISKLNAAGNALVYSTYLGGNAGADQGGFEAGFSIAVDSAGNAYVAGQTRSTNFPTANPIQATFGGGFPDGDAFVTKLNATGNALVYSTYLGGSENDIGFEIAVDSAGSAYVSGVARSTNFPTANAFQTALNGPSDAFLTKLNPTGSAFVYSTYFGGSGDDSANGIAVNASNEAYLAGGTSSTDLPTVNPTQAASGGGIEGFVTRFNAAGSVLLFSTYLGGSGGDAALSIALDSALAMYVVGRTTSTDFPTLIPIQAANGGGQDAFVAKISPDAATPTPTPTPTPNPAQLLNISTRLRVRTDDNVMIGGVIIRGNLAKPVVFRALGPSLTNSQIPADEVLADPVLSLHGPNGELITRNDNWKDDQRPLIEGTIYQPSDDRESVIVATLLPDAYTAIVTGKNRTTGIGVVEAYDNDPAVDSVLANISTRGFVVNGDDTIIGGFILGEPNEGPRHVVIRALGPSLANFGVPDVLQDPLLELRNENGSVIATNDDWQQSAQQAEILASGLAPTDQHESAIAATLPMGRYFGIVQGKAGATGVAVVEIYSLQ